MNETTRILPATRESLVQLAEIQGHDRCVLTVYFPDSLLKKTKASEKLVEFPATQNLDQGLTPDELEHYGRSLDFWREQMRSLSLPPAESWMGVVSWLTEEAAFVRLPAPVKASAHLDNSPFLFPAARMLDDLETYAVVYADHRRAAIYLAALGALQEEGRIRGEIKNHVRKGGWSQQRYERRRDKEIHVYCQGILERLEELVRTEDLRRVVLAGDPILLGELEKRMTPAMRQTVVCVLPMEDKKAPRAIYEETLTAAAEEEKREEEWLLNAIRNEHASGGKAVVGPVPTLAALREQRVHRLLIGPLDDVDFWRCGACGASGLGRKTTCPQCRSAVYAQSASNEFMDLAFAGNSRVEFAGDTDLGDIGGVGALLRW